MLVDFRKKGKLNLRFVDPFEIIRQVEEVAYRFVFSPSLSFLHLVFYVLMLPHYIQDKSHVISLDTVQLSPDLTYEEKLVAILNRQVQNLPAKDIVCMKAQWFH